MFSNQEWKYMYNNVFKVFPSPDTLNQKIILKTRRGKRVFNNSSELLSFICINGHDVILSDEIEYILNDNLLKSEIENDIQMIIQSLK